MRGNTVKTMRWVIAGIGLVAGIALLAAGATLIGVVLVVMAGLRIAMLVAMQRRMRSFGSTAGTPGGAGRRRSGQLLQRLARNELDVAATAIGIAPDELRRAVDDGRTISAVAADAGIPSRRVVDAVVRDAEREGRPRRRGRQRRAEPGTRRAQPTAALGRALRAQHPGDARRRATPGLTTGADGRRRRPEADQEKPVSRTVMLRRPGGRPRPAGAVPGNTFGTPWNTRRCSRPNTSRSPLRSSRSRYGPDAPVDVGETERARVAEADGHDRRVRRLFAVLVEAELGAVGIEVHDGGVGRERPRLDAVVPVGRGDRGASHPVDARGERLHRRAVGVVGGAAVGVRVPVPPEAHRLQGHQVTGGHAWVAEPRGWLAPIRGTRPRAPVARRGPASRGPRTTPGRGSHTVRVGSAGIPSPSCAAGAVAGAPERDGLAAQLAGPTAHARRRPRRSHRTSVVDGRPTASPESAREIETSGSEHARLEGVQLAEPGRGRRVARRPPVTSG